MSSSKFFTRSTLSIVFGLSLLFTTGLANAVPPPKPQLECEDLTAANFCDDQLGALCLAIDGAESLSQRDESSMKGKVEMAALKINSGKFENADKKLDNIDDKLDNPKISESDAMAISFAVMQAQLCLASLF